MDLFTLVARLGMDSSEYEKGISKARGSFSDLGSFVSAKAVAFGTMAAHAIEKAVDAAANLGQSAIQAAADVEAEQAQFRATFGELQGSAEKAFDAIEKSTGIMDTRLQKVGTKVFSQFKGAGIDAADAISEMERYTTLAADAAAYYDITLEDADERLRSFLRGNTEAGDAIGLFTSESQRNTAAMEKYGQKWTALTEAQKQMLMLDISEDIYKQSGAIGQAARESDSWTNITANLKEVWRQTLAVVGAPIKAAISPVIEKITTFLQDDTVQLRFEQFGLTIGTIANQTFAAVEGFIDKLLTPGTGENSILNGIGAFADAVVNIGNAVLTDAIEFVQSFFGVSGSSEFMENLGAMIEDISAFASEHSEDISQLIVGLTGFMAITNPFGAFIMALGVIIANWNDIKAAIVMCKNWFDRFVDAKTPEDYLNLVQEAWSGIVGTIQKAIDLVGSFFGKDHTTVSKYVSDVQNAANKYGPYVTSNPDTVPGLSQGISALFGYLPGYATGLDYVPYNNYIARLHEGEAILTKEENAAWRSGMSALPVDYTTMGSVIGAAVREALDGAGVYMNGDRVGDLVTDRVSRNITVKAQSRRYQPV